EIWTRRADPHVTARVMGSFLLAEGHLLVPVTSVESTLAAAQDAVCCNFRGSLVALDPATGREMWRRYTIDTPAVKTGTNANGVEMMGPSGAT
ncbi:MAG: hypothetical protein GWO22_35110, partial [Actinobacteria bacterium]|nr:hypothetical protein [Actinomycetota bacterium]